MYFRITRRGNYQLSSKCLLKTRHMVMPSLRQILTKMNWKACVISSLAVTEQQQQAIAIQTIHQADDQIGEWNRQRHGWVTASVFGNICRRRASFASLTISFLYSKTRETPAMWYGKLHEGEAWQSCNTCLKLTHPDASVAMTGLHVDLSYIAKIINMWPDLRKPTLHAQ